MDTVDIRDSHFFPSELAIAVGTRVCGMVLSWPTATVYIYDLQRKTCMMPVEPWSITVQFNEAINARDLDGLAALMTDDHRFVDTEAHAVIGKDACLESWRGFFEQFPDYRNVFTTQIPRDNVVLVVGYSTCSFEPLDGPAVWRAIIRANKVAEWRVYEDTQTTRHTLGIT